MNAQLRNDESEVYIGGGNVAGILGVSPYKTPYAEYLGIIEGRAPEVDAERARFFERRKALEPFAADLFAQRTGLSIIRRNERYTHPQFDFIKAEIDFETSDGCNGEIKTVHPLAAKAWGPAGEDDCPVYVTAQSMHGLMVTGRSRCYVQALIGFDDDRVYLIERDDALIANMLERELAFWRRVQDRDPPDPMDSSDLLRMFARDAGSTLEADDEIAGVYHELVATRSQWAEADERREGLEERVKLALRDNAILAIDGVPVLTWRTQTSQRFDQKAFAAAHPDLFNEFKRASDSRVLRIR